MSQLVPDRRSDGEIVAQAGGRARLERSPLKAALPGSRHDTESGAGTLVRPRQPPLSIARGKSFGIGASVVVAVGILAMGEAPALADAPPRFVGLSLGYGLSASLGNEDLDGGGVWVEGEYGWLVSPWFTPRAFGGMLLTFPNQGSQADQAKCRDAGIACDVSAKIGFLGVKGRVTIPIPYVAPFFELGVGGMLEQPNDEFVRREVKWFHSRAGAGVLISFRLRLLVRLEATNVVLFREDAYQNTQAYLAGLGTYF